MTNGIDWEQERARANRHTQSTLLRLAAQAGYEVEQAGGKGSHVKATRPGLPRPIIIPSKIFRLNAMAIIDQLRKGSG